MHICFQMLENIKDTEDLLALWQNSPLLIDARKRMDNLEEPEFLRDWHFDKGRLRSSLEILSLSGYLHFEPYPKQQFELLRQSKVQPYKGF